MPLATHTLQKTHRLWARIAELEQHASSLGGAAKEEVSVCVCVSTHVCSTIWLSVKTYTHTHLTQNEQQAAKQVEAAKSKLRERTAEARELSRQLRESRTQVSELAGVNASAGDPS